MIVDFNMEIQHLRELIDRQFSFHEREHILIRDGMEEFKKTLDVRLTHMNEFREQLNNERKDYLRAPEYTRLHEVLLNRVSTLERFQWVMAGGFAVLLVIIQAVKYFVK